MTDDELKLVLASHSAEVRRHFDMTAEGLRHEVQLVAENITDSRRETAELRSELRRGFEETQAMIRFSHAELDRRVRALEDAQRILEQTVSDIQARLERVEGSTH